jgi:hypothetical protein
LKFQQPLPVPASITGIAGKLALIPVSIDDPTRLGRAKAQIGQQGINSAQVFQRGGVGVIEDREDESLPLGQQQPI